MRYFYIKYVRYAVFLAIYIININLPNVFAARKNVRFFYKFRGGILRICGRLAQTRVASVLLSLVWGAVYLGVSRKFSLNLLDLRSNLKVAYRLLLASPSRLLRRYRALRYTDRAVRAARR